MKKKSSKITTKVCKTDKEKYMYSSYFRYPKDLDGEVKVIKYEEDNFRGAVSRFTLEIRNMYEQHIHECNTFTFLICKPKLILN